jgi:cysteine desulfurase
MAAAAEIAVRESEVESERQERLREQLWAAIRGEFPDALRNGAAGETLANTLNVSFPGHEAESLLMALDLAGVCASSGSACMVGTVLPSHVLLAMGRTPELARAAVRFSLGRGTQERDIQGAASVLAEIARRHALT